jgi:hypothetical protein
MCAAYDELGTLPDIGHFCLLYMHYKEYLKTSNSGVLLTNILPENAKICLYGTDQMAAEFLAET